MTPADQLIAEVLRQYERREQMYRDAGGNPNTAIFRRGELTAYLPHALIVAVRKAVATSSNRKP